MKISALRARSEPKAHPRVADVARRQPSRTVALAVVVATVLAVGACSSPTPVPTTSVLLLTHPGPAMTQDAPVTLQGSEVGKVAQTETLPDKNVLHLAIDTAQLHLIPANVVVKIVVPTAVQLIQPANPAAQQLQAGQVLQAP